MPRLRTEAPADNKTGATKTDTIHEVFDIANDKSFFFGVSLRKNRSSPREASFPRAKTPGISSPPDLIFILAKDTVPHINDDFHRIAVILNSESSGIRKGETLL